MFSWSFSNQKNHSPTWYLTGIIVMGSLLVFGVVMQLYLLSVVAVLFSGVYLLIENNNDSIVHVVIDERKITLNQSQYLWQDFENFHIVEVKGVPFFLRFIPQKKFSTFIDVPFTEEVNIEEVISFLLTIFPDGKNVEISKTDTFIQLTKM